MNTTYHMFTSKLLLKKALDSYQWAGDVGPHNISKIDVFIGSLAVAVAMAEATLNDLGIHFIVL